MWRKQVSHSFFKTVGAAVINVITVYMEYILSIYVIYKEEDSICKKVLGKNKVLKVSYKFR